MTPTMTQDELTTAIDVALERFRARDIVSSAEVIDVLLDLRLTVNAFDQLEQLLDEAAAAPAAP
jgi:hypothetical protein